MCTARFNTKSFKFVHDIEKFQPVLTIYSNCFSTKYSSTGIYNGITNCSLRGTNLMFINNVD